MPSGNAVIPQAGEALTKGSAGLCADSWYRLFSLFASLFNSTQAAVNDPVTGIAQKAAKSQTLWGTWTFAYPENGPVILIAEAKYAFKITEIVARTELGTATLQFAINNVNVGSGSINASTTKTVVTPSTPNQVNAGDEVEVTFSSVTGTAYLTVQISGPGNLA